MSKINLTTVAFKGTAEQEAQLRAELKEIAKMPGSLMPALQTAQNIYGYLRSSINGGRRTWCFT